MPGAHTHDTITLISGAVLAPLTYFTLQNLTQSPEAARTDAILLFGAHILSGMMFSPDLDIDSAIDNRWGIFRWIWEPYMWVVPHRSRYLSHGLVLPPLLRILYFFAVTFLAFTGLAWALGRVGIVMPDYYRQVIDYLSLLAYSRPREVEVFLLGFITGSAAHTFADFGIIGAFIGVPHHQHWHPHQHHWNGQRR